MTYGALHSTKLVAEGSYDEAIIKAGQEIAAEPDEPESFFNRAAAYAGLGRFAEAIRDYETALGMNASASNLDPAALDDELFFAVREMAMTQKDRPNEAVATINRYRRLLPQGRHVDDIQKWVDHIHGVETVWYREHA